MNSPAASSKPRHQIWPWIVGLALAPVIALGGMVWSACHLSRDATALRRQIMAASGGGWHTRVQFTADRTALGAVRGGLSLAKDLPCEAREALAAVRSASIGVYERADTKSSLAGGAVLADADKIMALHGWKRLVGVRESGKTVLIYLPAAAEKATPSRICLAVCDRCELVIVAAEIDADALAQFALRKIDRHEFAGL
jgi:hypothetical protein